MLNLKKKKSTKDIFSNSFSTSRYKHKESVNKRCARVEPCCWLLSPAALETTSVLLHWAEYKITGARTAIWLLTASLCTYRRWRVKKRKITAFCTETQRDKHGFSSGRRAEDDQSDGLQGGSDQSSLIWRYLWDYMFELNKYLSIHTVINDRSSEFSLLGDYLTFLYTEFLQDVELWGGTWTWTDRLHSPVFANCSDFKQKIRCEAQQIHLNLFLYTWSCLCPPAECKARCSNAPLEGTGEPEDEDELWVLHHETDIDIKTLVQL